MEFSPVSNLGGSGTVAGLFLGFRVAGFDFVRLLIGVVTGFSLVSGSATGSGFGSGSGCVVC